MAIFLRLPSNLAPLCFSGILVPCSFPSTHLLVIRAYLSPGYDQPLALFCLLSTHTLVYWQFMHTYAKEYLISIRNG